MKFTIDHNNLNVFDLDKSLSFYQEALGLTEKKRFQAPDGSFILIFLGDSATSHSIELTWMRDRTEPYDLGDNEFHIAFVTDDYDASYQHHLKMGCICFENKAMGIYFIEDPDGYWIEIIPKR